jgi:hypothetical protein
MKQERRQRFFFEKKNQKTFVQLGSLHPEKQRRTPVKVFCCFFSKKQAFLLA